MNNRLKYVFDSIHAEEELKQSTRNFLHSRLYETHRKGRVRIGYAFLCCLFLLAGIGGHTFYFTPVAYISIDINPSIELGLNQMDRIISVIPYNEDGAKAVENLSLKNMKYDQAIVTLLESGEIAAYLSSGVMINISVASDHDEKNMEIQQRVMECTKLEYGTVRCHSISEDDAQNAHHAGLSSGKYRIFLELKSLYPEITLDDIKGMTIHQIQKLIDEYSGGSESSGENPNNSKAKKGCRHGHEHE